MYFYSLLLYTVLDCKYRCVLGTVSCLAVDTAQHPTSIESSATPKIMRRMSNLLFFTGRLLSSSVTATLLPSKVTWRWMRKELWTCWMWEECTVRGLIRRRKKRIYLDLPNEKYQEQCPFRRRISYMRGTMPASTLNNSDRKTYKKSFDETRFEHDIPGPLRPCIKS